MPMSRSIHGNGILLAHRHQHIIAFEMMIRLAGRNEIAPALCILLGFDPLEDHAGELAVRVYELLGHKVVEDRDIFPDRVLLLPWRRLHLLETGADDHLHIVTAKPSRRAAAIHRGVAAAQHDDAPADLGYVFKRDAGKPVDADMDVSCCFLAAGQVKVTAARRACANEDCVIAFGEKRLHAVDGLREMHHRPKACDVADLFVDDFFRQSEARDLAADHAPGASVAIIDMNFIAERGEVACNGEGGWPGADTRNFLSVARGDLGQEGGNIALVVRRHPFQAADRHRLLFDSAAAAGRLARTIARAPQDSRKHVRLPVDHVGVGVSPVCDQPDVFGHGRMRWTCPLAVNNLVEVVRTTDVRGLQRRPPHNSGSPPNGPQTCYT
jgi:hypothetical protein